jgi:hypothetical protein
MKMGLWEKFWGHNHPLKQEWVWGLNPSVSTRRNLWMKIRGFLFFSVSGDMRIDPARTAGSLRQEEVLREVAE